MGAVIGISLFVAAVVVVQFGTLLGLAALAGMLLAFAALFIFTDLLGE